MTQHAAAVPFSGNAESAFRLAESTLAAIGFGITERTPTLLVATGPRMTSTKQNPMAGISRIELRSGGGELAAEAELGGADRLARFTSLFPPLLSAGLAVVLGTVFWLTTGPGLWVWILAGAAGGNTALWLILGPFVGNGIRNRTRRAVDTLLANMAVVGSV